MLMRREGYHKKKAFFRRTDEGKTIWHDAYQYAILEEEWNLSRWRSINFNENDTISHKDEIIEAIYKVKHREYSAIKKLRFRVVEKVNSITSKQPLHYFRILCIIHIK